VNILGFKFWYEIWKNVKTIVTNYWSDYFNEHHNIRVHFWSFGNGLLMGTWKGAWFLFDQEGRILVWL